MVTCTGNIVIHEGADVLTYVRTDVHDVMAIKPNFLTSMGYHIFLMHLFIVLNRLCLITHLNAQWNRTTGHY